MKSNHLFGFVFAALLLASQNMVLAQAEEKERVFSGPQPGEKVAPFKVLTIKDDEPKELEIVKKTENRTTLICFVHKLNADDRILYGLPLVDFYAKKHKDLDSHFVLLSKDQTKILKMLRRWANAPIFTKSLVSLSADGSEGPGVYGLNRNVAMTVVVAKGDKVVSNLVYQSVNARDLETIMQATAKAMGKPKPTLAKVQGELRTQRQRERDKRIKASPVFKIAPNPELGRIMFGVVNARGAFVANRLSKQLTKWAGDDQDRQATLKKYCKAVLDGDFKLNRYSQTALEKLTGE